MREENKKPKPPSNVGGGFDWMTKQPVSFNFAGVGQYPTGRDLPNSFDFSGNPNQEYGPEEDK